jgi:hypothetical protein
VRILAAAVVLFMACGRASGEVTVCGPPQGHRLQTLPEPSDSQRKFAAAHPWPQLVHQGGPVQKSPRVVAVFFGEDPLREQTEALLQSYGCTSWWREAVAEYGVGDFTFARSVVINEPFPVPPQPNDDTLFRPWVVDHEKLLEPREGEVFVFFAPEAAYAACPENLGWHEAVKLSAAQPVPFALVKDCPDSVGWFSTVMNVRAHVTSHELLELAVDPFPNERPAWVGLSDTTWPTEAFAENADLCDPLPVVSREYPFALATGWSNRRAELGLLPCSSNAQPFATSRAREAKVDLTLGPGNFTVDVHSDLPDAEVTVSAYALGCVSVMPSSVKAHDGETVHFTATRYPPDICPPRPGDSGEIRIETRSTGAYQTGLTSLLPLEL